MTWIVRYDPATWAAAARDVDNPDNPDDPGNTVRTFQTREEAEKSAARLNSISDSPFRYVVVETPRPQRRGLTTEGEPTTMPAMSERDRYEVGPYTDALFTLAKEVDPGAYVMNYALGDGSNGRWVYVTGEDEYNIVMILTGVFEPEPRKVTPEFAAALERHRGTAMEVRR